MLVGTVVRRTCVRSVGTVGVPDVVLSVGTLVGRTADGGHVVVAVEGGRLVPGVRVVLSGSDLVRMFRVPSVPGVADVGVIVTVVGLLMFLVAVLG